MSYKRNDDEKKIILLKPFKELYSYLHFHKALEIVFVQDGVYEANVGEEHFDLIKDDILIIPSKIPHKINSISKVCFCNILVVPEIFFLPIGFNINDCYYGKINDRSLFLNIQNIKNDGSINDYSNFLLFLTNLTKNYQKTKIRSAKKERLAFDLLKYIHENYKETITLEILENKFGYSKYYISKIFNTEIGCPLNTYINYLRNDFIEENKSKGKRLIDLIYESGFQTLSAYYRFKNSKRKRPII